jgi:FixJ family two-component response regulator
MMVRGSSGQADRAERSVIVVDDDLSVREALGSLIGSVGLRSVLFGSVAEFLAAGVPNGPSCLVLDVRLPERSGFDLQRELVERGIQVPIIFITGHGDIPMSVRAMKRGAIEFLTKPFREQDVLDAIYLGLARDQRRREDERGLDALRERFEMLSPRELMVMAHLATGRLNKQIAAQLGLSEVTVKVHRRHLMQKMAATSLAELVSMASKLNIAGHT